MPYLHEEAWPLCGDDAYAKTKFQLKEELSLVRKRDNAFAKTKSQLGEEFSLARKGLVCRCPSNIRRDLILGFLTVPCLHEEAWPLCGDDEALPISDKLDIGLCPAGVMPS
ncbi:hypothetical protein Adt_25292 [Abeliophyllum distichum]|uniref:Uncharacterized protein n=1 Tax=Abeliophyllum distichum TaxID=126358 RepID=A0ABD1SG79_9LAMI